MKVETELQERSRQQQPALGLGLMQGSSQKARREAGVPQIHGVTLGPRVTLERKPRDIITRSAPRPGGTLVGVQLVPGSSNSTSELHRSHFVVFAGISDVVARELPIKADDLPDTGSVRACGPYNSCV